VRERELEQRRVSELDPVVPAELRQRPGFLLAERAPDLTRLRAAEQRTQERPQRESARRRRRPAARAATPAAASAAPAPAA